ncbi:MAG TPA: phosphatase PAP2 family protein [Nevskiaceae bacterium]|nr:phosphatase PAP2 family protein [Nevskiaceae bacterium]
MEQPESTAVIANVVRPQGTLLHALLALWPYKLCAPIVGLSAFFFAYFWVLAHPLFTVTVMPLTWFDRAIPFTPLALPWYLSLWPYLLLAPGLIERRGELGFYYLGTVALAVIGLTIFLLWPTAVPQPDINWAAYPDMDFLKTVDRAGNACPSLHVAFCVFTALWNARMLKRVGDRGPFRVLSALWCVAIVWSTLATRQHVALDVLAGAALGAALAAIHLHWHTRRYGRVTGVVCPPTLDGH